MDNLNEKALIKEVRLLRDQLSRLNNNLRIRTFNSIWLSLSWTLIEGLIKGVGTVLGATLVISLIAYVLAALDWLPVVGNWLLSISNEIKLKD